MPPGVRDREPIRLKEGEHKTGIEIALIPTGAISGRVTDADGEPVQGVYINAQSNVGAEAGPPTDESGEFRVGGLAPGKYRLKATRNDFLVGPPETRTDGTVEEHDAGTWYPGVLSEKQAGKVTVQPGNETTGADIQLVRIPFVRVSGRVADIPRGVERPMITVWQESAGNGTGLGADGKFEFWRLEPGKYRITAEWTAANGETVRTAGAEIEIAGSNIDNIELRVVPDSNISGRLEFEDEDARKTLPKESAQRMIVVIPVGDAEASFTGPVPVAEDGTFHLDKVSAGKYKVGLAWDSAYVKSTRLGSSASDGPLLDLSHGAGSADLSLTVSAATGSLSGTVRDENGKPFAAALVLLPDEMRLFAVPKNATAQADGAFAFPSLTPGSYRLGIEGDDEGDMEDVVIGPGEKVTKDLKRQ
jgi:protocatechuate 3,4-dioxygenase beta subunit